MTRRFLIRPIPVLLLAAQLTLLAPTAASAQIVVPVTTVKAQAGASAFELDAVVEPVRQATVSAQAQGRIVSLHVKAGDRVRAGQLLAVIDDREAQTGVARASAQVAEAEAQLRNARASFERNRDLRAQNFISQAAVDASEAQLKAAQAARDSAGAGARQSALAQGFTRVSAPFDGFVRDTQAEAGDLAVPGRPLLTVYAPQPLRAVAQVGASRMSLARAASQVEVQLPDGRWVAPASRQVLPVADPVSQTVQWRLELAAAQSAMLVPGQQVKVRFAGAGANANNSARAEATAANSEDAASVRALSVPREAVLRRGELTAVYVASDNGFVLKAVRLGATTADGQVQVLAGLSAGERVALDPVRAGLSGAQAAR